MRRRARPDRPEARVSFLCSACGHSFQAEPERIEDAPELEHHPYRYFAGCDICSAEAGQAPWEERLFKAWSSATGPRTPEGLAAAAANLDGHPTPEEARRTRFNALKHGAFARTATYFPARPGAYAQCEGCEHRYTVCGDQPACLKRTELFMRHQIAFETKDPGLLTGIMADTHAAVSALLADMLRTVIQDGGPRVKEVQWYHDKDGALHLASYTDDDGREHQIYELKAHPLIRPIIELLSRNSMTLADLGMTPKVQDEQDLVEGHLAGQNTARQEVLEYQRRQTAALENLREMVERSHQLTSRDPVLIEHGQEGGDA